MATDLILEMTGADGALENLRAGKTNLLAENLDAHVLLLKINYWEAGGLMAENELAFADEAQENLRAAKPGLLVEGLTAENEDIHELLIFYFAVFGSSEFAVK
ncbi:hypothetical protein BY996DRAFT_6410328 [Phakopsora pachyrhizi]|nr:hypothetical protein BY996DRAFT_6410328 [Phakopsora pachyrhizi]